MGIFRLESPYIKMHEQRKSDHIRINLEEDVNFRQLTTGLENYHFLHQVLPEINLAEVDTSVSFLGKRLKAPLLISSMTGGTDQARQINYTLAEAAEMCGIAMGLGSQRAALENPAVAPTFQVRSVAPTAMLSGKLPGLPMVPARGPLLPAEKRVKMPAARIAITSSRNSVFRPSSLPRTGP